MEIRLLAHITACQQLLFGNGLDDGHQNADSNRNDAENPSTLVIAREEGQLDVWNRVT